MNRDLVEHVAKAIAWDDLTPKGKKDCVWPKDFGESELGKYRMQAVCAIDAVNSYKDSDNG